MTIHQRSAIHYRIEGSKIHIPSDDLDVLELNQLTPAIYLSQICLKFLVTLIFDSFTTVPELTALGQLQSWLFVKMDYECFGPINYPTTDVILMPLTRPGGSLWLRRDWVGVGQVTTRGGRARTRKFVTINVIGPQRDVIGQLFIK